jgi:GT2 family glycosyltransferase
MNAAAKFANGRWLFLVNNDTEFPAHALDALKQVLHAAPVELGMIGPVTNSAGNGQRLYDPSRTKQEWLELGAWLNTNPTRLMIPTYRCDFFCIAIRYEVWNELNGLDRVFGMGYYEDFDFSLRLRQAGHEQAISEDIFIYHQGSATFSPSSQIKKLIRKNKEIIKDRHKNARFLHVRECNLLILKSHPYARASHDNESTKFRRKMRFDSLKKDVPKSFIKRILWAISIKKINPGYCEN